MKTHRRIHFTALFALAAGWLDITPAQAQLSVQWITHYGTTAEERGNAIAVDGLGQSWVTGYTYGSLGGTHAGSTINADIFLTRLSPTGNVDFNRQRGGTGDETGYGVALVGSGTVFAGGAVSSSTIDGQGSGGSLEVRYDTSGNWQGTTRFGVTDSYTFGLAGNATGLLMAGNAYGSFDGQTHLGGGDAFLSKRDSTGALVWTRFVGTASQETGRAAAFDSAGNAYLIGETYGNIVGANRGSLDFFITRYDSAGNLTLLRRLLKNLAFAGLR